MELLRLLASGRVDRYLCTHHTLRMNKGLEEYACRAQVVRGDARHRASLLTRRKLWRGLVVKHSRLFAVVQYVE